MAITTTCFFSDSNFSIALTHHETNSSALHVLNVHVRNPNNMLRFRASEPVLAVPENEPARAVGELPLLGVTGRRLEVKVYPVKVRRHIKAEVVYRQDAWQIINQ